MLARSGGRRQRRHTSQLLAASFAQLQLQFLAPAQLRWHSSNPTLSTSPNNRPRKPSDLSRTAERRIATAADQQTTSAEGSYTPPNYNSGEGALGSYQHVPWDTRPRPSPLQARASYLRPYRDPIIVNSTIQSSGALIKVQQGVHGTISDLLQHLNTSLRVGRLERAEAIIQRLADQCSPDSPEIVHAHNAFLGESLRTLATHPDGSEEARDVFAQMSRWFDSEVRGKTVEPDTNMLVVMIRGAIRALDGKPRDQIVRRFVEIARERDPEMLYEVLESEEYDDNEFTVLGRVSSEHFGEEMGELTAKDKDQFVEIRRTAKFGRPDGDMHDVPKVISTEQKGEGLRNVKKSISAFFSLPPLGPDAPFEEQRARAFERQYQMERTAVEIAIDQWRKADADLRKLGVNTSMQRKPVGALMWEWYQALLPVLEQELAECKQTMAEKGKTEHDRQYYGPYLEVNPAPTVAATTILQALSYTAKGKDFNDQEFQRDIKLSELTLGIGSALEQESAVRSTQPRSRRQHDARKSLDKRRFLRLMRQSRKVDEGGDPTNANGSVLPTPDQNSLTSLGWPTHVKVKLGAVLVAKLVETVQVSVTREHPRTREKVTRMQPAFTHKMPYTGGKKIGVLEPNHSLVEMLESEPIPSLLAKRLPMIVEPRPWSGFSEGGYWHYPTSIVRLKSSDKTGRTYYQAAQDKGDTGQLMAGLNALGKVPWVVNRNVFNVQLEAWNSGEAIANFAPLHPKIEPPPEPENNGDLDHRKKWLLECRALENKLTGLHSQRCFQNFQMEIARAMLNETMYFPHNIDFRGRAYPIPPYLNHMGADNARALLIFAEGKELGPHGLRWLKIHLANVFGYDKASLSEREDFTMSHLEEIYDSVNNPLGGKRWWLRSEDAWQTLGACFELAAALDSPDPERHVSHLPIHQDGTCNGLQHYAALGGDKAGAEQVNLEPSDRPGDVYTGVLNAVVAEIDEDAANGNKIALKLQGKITRKVVKQPVMTNVYGVTFHGARAQVKRQLEELFPDVHRYDEVNYTSMASYITLKIFRSLGTMFRGAQAIQNWLGQCAETISTSLSPEQVTALTAEHAPGKEEKKDRRAKFSKKTNTENTEAPVLSKSSDVRPLFKSTVVWTTPLRLPVVQPYRAAKTNMVSTAMQNVKLLEPQSWDPISKRRQLQAFPPNFIHSLDATHMLLSALKCNEVGITFASIHDSFWTHACDVSSMSTVLRDAFVAMHSDDIVGRLRQEFETRYKGFMTFVSVLARSKVGKEIKAYRTKHKKQIADVRGGELTLEMQRRRLLESEDPAERAQGEAMVTPGSIFAAAMEKDPSMFKDEVQFEAGSKLGEIPENASVDNSAEMDAPAAPAEQVEEVEGAVGDAETPHAEDDEAPSDRTADRTAEASEKKRLQAMNANRKIHVWMPVRFPEVPAKGDFDVTRLRQSKYFFH
ncbi:hypothetical protein MBLNU230_g1778t1 [Neophaeotheca triangularis]